MRLIIKFNIVFAAFLLGLTLICVSNALYADAVLSATVNKSTVAVGEQFQLTYSLNTSGNRFQGPDLKDFYVLGGPNQSTSMQFINGSVSQSISFSYILQPKAEGTFKIGFASIEAEGKRIQSNGIIMTVVKANAQAQQQQGGNKQQGQQQDANAASGLSDKNIFLKAELNKTNVYRGEALVVTFKLYTNVNIVNYTVSKMPSMNGFWSQDFEMPQQLELHNETVNGVNYKVGELKKIVLFPQQSGTLSIDPMELECIARVQVKQKRNMNDPFGMFQDPFFNDPFFGGVRDLKYAFRSNKIIVNVKELPGNAPPGYTGSVGKFSFDASLDKTETKANEPVSLKIKISGAGNLKLIEAPEIKFPPDLETYDPKIIDNSKPTMNGVSGNKIIEYLLIPRREGSYSLEPITFSYFDLEKKQYVSKSTGPFHLKVGRGSGSTAAFSSGMSKSDFQMIGKDIRYIKVGETKFNTGYNSFYGSLPFYVMTISPFLLFGGLLFYRRRTEELNSDIRSLKRRKATALAQKRLAASKKLLDADKHHPFYEEVFKALWGYLSDKLSIPVADLTKESVSAALLSRGVASETVDALLKSINDCEMARFGGMDQSQISTQVYNEALQVITRLEGEIK